MNPMRALAISRRGLPVSQRGKAGRTVVVVGRPMGFDREALASFVPWRRVAGGRTPQKERRVHAFFVDAMGPRN